MPTPWTATAEQDLLLAIMGYNEGSEKLSVPWAQVLANMKS